MIRYNPKGKDRSIFTENSIEDFKEKYPRVLKFMLSFLEKNRAILNKEDFYLLFKKWNDDDDSLYSCMALAHVLYLSGINFAENMAWDQILELFANYLERFEKDED